MSDANDFVAAYFDKSGSDDSALTFSPKWQRRFFIFSDSQRMLYYFKVGAPLIYAYRDICSSAHRCVANGVFQQIANDIL